MNIVKELRKKMGIQQKELAMEIGVSIPTVSNWEHGKADPSGERLKKLAQFFGVDELVILGQGSLEHDGRKVFTPVDPKISGISETQQIVEYVLDRIGQLPSQEVQIKTQEAKILAKGIDKLPKEQREQALSVVRAMFNQYADYFEKGDDE